METKQGLTIMLAVQVGNSVVEFVELQTSFPERHANGLDQSSGPKRLLRFDSRGFLRQPNAQDSQGPGWFGLLGGHQYCAASFAHEKAVGICLGDEAVLSQKMLNKPLVDQTVYCRNHTV